MPISEAHCTGNLLALLRHAGHEGAALLRRVPSVHPFVPRHAPMGFDLHHPWRRSKSAADILVLAPNRAERCSSNSGLAPGPATLARRPASRPGQTGSPRRTTGGNPVPSAPRPVNSPLSIRGNDREGVLSLIRPLAHPMARSDCRPYARSAIDMVAQVTR